MTNSHFYNNPSPLWIVDAETLQIIDTNKAAVKNYGYTRKEFCKKSITDLQSKEELISIFGNQKGTVDQLDLIGTIEHHDKWNNSCSVRMFSCPMEYRGKQARLIKALPLDPRPEELQLVDQKAEELKYHLANSPLAYGIWNESFDLIKFSPKITEWLGFTEEDLLGKNSTELAFNYVAHDDFLKIKEKIDAILSGEESQSCVECGVTAQNGKIRYLKFYNSALTDDKGRLISVLLLIEDQTELIKNKQITGRQREIIENISNFVGLIDTTGSIDYINPSGKKMLGISENTHLKNENIQSYHSEITLEFIEQNVFPKAIEDGVWEGEITFKDANGKDIPTTSVVSAHKSSKGNVEYYSTISRNISREQKIIEELKSERQKLELAMQGGDVGFWQYFPLEERLDIDHSWLAEKLGYDSERLENKMIWLEIIHPEDLPRVLEQFEQITTGSKDVFAEEVRVIKSDGSFLWIRSKAKVVEREPQGQVKKISGLHLDINDKKQTEEKFQYIAENVQDKISIFDTDANCIYTSPSTEFLLGYPPEEFRRLSVFDLVHPNDQEMVLESFQNLKNGKGKKRLSYRLEHKEGYFIWLETILKPVYDSNGDLKETHAISREISERKEYEKKLKEETEFIEKALNSLPGIFYVLDSDGNYIRTNKNLEKELGYTKDELDGMDPMDFYYEEDHERITKEIQKAFSGEEATAVAKLKKKDGSDAWYQITGTHFKQGGEDYILGAGIDISPRIQAEENLRYKGSLLSNLFTNAPVGIAMVNSQGDVVDINNNFSQMFGYEKEEILQQNIDNLITPDKYKIERSELLQKQWQGKDSFQFESIRIKKDGTEVPVLIGSVPIVINDNSIISYIIYVDITERRTYLEEVVKSLKEKKVLLQEIHHRVKNNLAIVSSLLQLQKFNTDDQNLEKALTDSEMRIQTMAMIHEQLYNVKSMSEISMGEYIEKLISSIRSIYDPTEDIDVVIKSDDIVLNINQAIPCALIINEIISNAFEHAFEPTLKGKVNLQIKQKGNQVVLVISDNGKGLPQDFNLNNIQSLGYTVVRTLVQQLFGDFEITSQKGTSITVTFKKEDGKGSSSLL